MQPVTRCFKLTQRTNAAYRHRSSCLVICLVCPVTDGTEPKMRPGPVEVGGAGPGRAAFWPIGPGFSGQWAGPGFRPDREKVSNQSERIVMKQMKSKQALPT